jgi:dCMP deaminase
MTGPLKLKYAEFYWDLAYAAQRQSVASREQVGCVIVTPVGIILPGWNGQPAGHHTNCCENTPVVERNLLGHPITRRKTDRSVLHAENNALGKAMQAGVSLKGAHLYSTVSPCDVCARSIIPSGIVAVIFDRPHDDLTGLHMLREAGIIVCTRTAQQANHQLNLEMAT